MDNKEFWESLCLPYNEIQNQIIIKKEHLINELKKFSNSKLISFNIFFNERLNSGDGKADIIAKFVKNPQFEDYIFINEFYDRVAGNFLDEYLNKQNHISLEKEDFMIHELYPLLTLFKKNKKVLMEIYYYLEFHKGSKGQIKLCNPSWNKEIKEVFEDNLNSLKYKVNQRYPKKKFTLEYNFDTNIDSFYFFGREKNQSVRRTFEKNTSLIGVSDLFVKIFENGNAIEIKCQDSNVLKIFLQHLESKCKLKLFDGEIKPTNSEELNENIKTFLISPRNSNDDLIVEEISLYSQNSSVLMKIGKKNGKDIRPTLLELDKAGFCDLGSKENIFNFLIALDNDIHARIRLENKENKNTFKLILNTNLIYRHEKKIKEFFREFKLELDTTYEAPLNLKDKKYYFHKFLEFEGKMKLSEEQKNLMEEMERDNIITLNQEQIWRSKTRKYQKFNSKEEAEKVFGEDIFLHKEIKSTKINLKEIKQFIYKKIRKEFGNIEIKEHTRKVSRSDFELFSILLEDKIQYFYIHGGKGNIKNLLEYFSRSLTSVIIITIKKTIKNTIDEKLFPVISFQDFYFEDNISKIKTYNAGSQYYADKKLEEVFETSLNAIRNVNSDNLNNYDEDMFEDDIFVIIKTLFNSGEKWGKEKKRKIVPEGILALSFFTSSKNKKNLSYIWDCKLAVKREYYDLNINEKRKAMDYLRVTKTPEVSNFSKNLSGYIIFSNKINSTNFKNFSKHILTYYKPYNRVWKGNIILFDLDALIKLVNFYNSNKKFYKDNLELIIKEFNLLVSNRGKKEYYINLDEEKIENLIKNIKKFGKNISINSEKIVKELEDISFN